MKRSEKINLLVERISQFIGSSRWIVTVSVFMLVILLAGCTKRIYVPVESVRTDSVSMLRVNVDTVEMRDSVILYVKGDTVVTERIKYRFRTRLRVDTVQRVCRDTVRVPVSVVAESGSGSRSKGFLSRAWSAVCLIGVGALLSLVALWVKRRLL
jgi:hypothetical protein